MLTGHWWVTDALEYQGPAYLASWVVWVIVSITLHELAHGWAALRQGDQTPRLTGHMTWNPIVHMGVQSLIVFAVVGIAWGAMPVDPTRFKSRFGDLIVSAAGPIMNVSLAIASMIGGALWLEFGPREAVDDVFFENVFVFFFLGASLNVVLALLNLLPIPPLDGSRILASVSTSFRRMTMHEQAPMAGLFAILVVFVFAGDVLWDIGDGAAAWGIVIVKLLVSGDAGEGLGI